MTLNVNEAIEHATQAIEEKKELVTEAAIAFDEIVEELDESGKSNIVALLLKVGALEKQADGTLKQTGKKISKEEAIKMLKKGKGVKSKKKAKKKPSAAKKKV